MKKVILGSLVLLMAVFAVVISQEKTFKAETAVLQDNIEALTGFEEEFEFPRGYPYPITCKVVVGSFLGIPIRCGSTVITCQGGGSGCNAQSCPSHPGLNN